jgi:hypothetical protein
VSPNGYSCVQKIGHSFLVIFLMQADFRTIGGLRSKLSQLFLSGISDLDSSLAYHAFPLHFALGQYIGIDHSCGHTLASSLRSLRAPASINPLLKFANRDKKWTGHCLDREKTQRTSTEVKKSSPRRGQRGHSREVSVVFVS